MSRNPAFRETSLQIFAFVLLCHISSGLSQDESKGGDSKGPQQTPQFPYPLRLGQMYSKIVSEVVDSSGYHTIEEYIDFRSSRAATVKLGRGTKEVFYQDPVHDIAMLYKPYTCVAKKIADHKLEGFEYEMILNDNQVPIRLTNVLALWMHAAGVRKGYERTNNVHTDANDAWQDGESWYARLEGMKMTARFFFSLIGEGEESQSQYTSRLEHIHLLSDGKDADSNSETTSTIQIVSIGDVVTDEEIEAYLEVPLGYGCNKDLREDFVLTDDSITGINFPDYYEGGYLINLELTATDHSVEDYQIQTDSVDVRLASSKDGQMQLIEVRSSEKDIKLVRNFHNKVAYEIDQRRGTCSMSHLFSYSAVECEESYEHGLIEFSNGLKKNINYLKDSMNKLSIDHCMRTKRLYDGGNSLLFLEGEDEPSASTKTRVIKVYRKIADRVDLESITFYEFDLKYEKLLATYHASKVDYATIEDSWGANSEIFDISEECYLNDELKHQGKDYAWFEVSYLVDQKKLNVIKKNPDEMRETFASSFRRLIGEDPTRLPWIDLSFTDDSLKFRVLILDQPPLQYTFNYWKGKIVSLTEGTKGTLETATAPDLKHCAALCQLHHCTIFSFVKKGLDCYFASVSIAGNLLSNHLVEQPESDSYTAPMGYTLVSLHQLMSRLQHQQFASMSLPKMPDELLVSQDESGMSKVDISKAIEDYSKKLERFLEQHSNQMPELVIGTMLSGHVIFLLPNKLEFDRDPLSEFDLDELAESLGSWDNDDELEPEDEKPPAFHVGIKMKRLKAANSPNASGQSSNENKYKARTFKGLTHDQCALACKDTRCGSFSYCPSRSDCTLSTVMSIGEAKKEDLLQDDVDCYVMERDFLNNYVKFPDIAVPKHSNKLVEEVGSASHCALLCITESEFNCLSFDYCSKEVSVLFKSDRCYLHKVHEPSSLLSTKQPSGSKNDSKPEVSSRPACDHYSRSYLAEFNRFESRQIDPKEMDNFVTTEEKGRSVFACAEDCIIKYTDCTGFQFCTDLSKIRGQEGGVIERTCTMIQGRLKPDEEEEITAVVDSKTNMVSKSLKGLVLEENCQVFSLRRGSMEGHRRDLALSGLKSSAEVEEEKQRDSKSDSSGLTFGGAFKLYFFVLLLTSIVGCGYVVLRDSENPSIRSRVDRVRAAMGFRP